jgi:cardiolipin synthase A/B
MQLLIHHIHTVLALLLFLYALVIGVFLLMENRRPRSTLAWMLVLFFAPGIGLLIYLFFGRDTQAFSKRSKLLMQDLEANARPLLAPILSRQDAELARLESKSIGRKRLMTLVRRNTLSVLTTRNRLDV